jgi:hypothetical protein
MRRMVRSQLKAAPYNPRVIDAYARKKIEENLRKVGMVAPITVNLRTGHVVGGHQRLAALDALEGTASYHLDVAVVDLDPAAEKAQNLFLNNPSAQGQWDTEALEELLREGGVDFLGKAGFDLVDLETIYGGDVPWLAQFDPARASAAAQAEIAALQDMQGAADAPTPEEAARRYAAGMAQKQQQKAEGAAEDTEIYAVVMFPSRREREDFMELLGARREDRYVSGARVWAALGQTPGAPRP